jgi:hypothetical protein
LQNITVHGSPSWNVIADKRGNADSASQVVIVTAHLDSINIRGGPTAPAPGLVEAAATYTDLTVETSLNPFASDHVPFINAGI